MRGKKYLNVGSIVEAAADYLNSRATISKIIDKCLKLSAKVEAGLAELESTETTIEPPKKIAAG